MDGVFVFIRVALIFLQHRSDRSCFYRLRFEIVLNDVELLVGISHICFEVAIYAVIGIIISNNRGHIGDFAFYLCLLFQFCFLGNGKRVILGKHGAVGIYICLLIAIVKEIVRLFLRVSQQCDIFV